MLGQTIPLFRASGKMMLRSRGVVFAVAAGSVQILAFGLMKDLDFGFGAGRIGFFDFALPGMAVFLAIFQLQDIMVAVAASYKARGTLKRLAVTRFRRRSSSASRCSPTWGWGWSRRRWCSPWGS